MPVCRLLCGHKFSTHLILSQCRIAGSYEKGMFSVIRNHQSVFQSDCTTKLGIKVSDASHPYLLPIVSDLDFSHSNRYVVVPFCFYL